MHYERLPRIHLCVSTGAHLPMTFLLITTDLAIEAEARKGLHPTDEFRCFADWRAALDSADGADLMFVDLESTLLEPHRIQGYEAFAHAKMDHPSAKSVPVVLIAPEPHYDLDFMVGWPGFLHGHVRKPVNYKVFRRASTWV